MIKIRKIFIDDASNTLNDIQKGCSARILTVDDIQSILDDNEKLINELVKYDVDFYIEYQEGDYKKGYSYDGTGFMAKIGDRGVKSLSVYRSKNRGVNRIVVDLNKNTELERKLLRKLFNINTSGTILL